MKHKVLKSKGISLIGRAREITYSTVVEAVELGPDARRKTMYYVDFHYELENGHVRADIFFRSRRLLHELRGHMGLRYADWLDSDRQPTGAARGRSSEETPDGPFSLAEVMKWQCNSN